MRLIDADAFKAYMRGALEQTRRCYPDGGEWAEAVTEEFCRDIDEQPTAQPEPQWIPCSERLPEETGFYLVKVCAEYRQVRIYAFSPWDMDKERKYWVNDSDNHSHVFNHFVEAWMPLPKPYRGGGE